MSRYIEADFTVVINDEDVEFTCDGYIRPAQKGGLTDPSWDEHVELEDVYLSGLPLRRSEANREIISAAEEALIAKWVEGAE